MVSLVVNEYPTRVKTKKTVSMDTATVEEVVNVEEDEGTSEASTSRRGRIGEETFEGRPPGVVGVAEGDVEGQGGVASVGTDGEWGDVEEAGLEEVSGRDICDVVILSFKRDHSREIGGRGEEVVLGDEAVEVRGLGVFYRPPIVQEGVPNKEELVGVRLVRVLFARRRRKRVSGWRVLGNWRVILLVRETCRFHWRRCRCRSVGRRGVWTRRTRANE
jgi:hypothetical protein